jgi:hypothetical protein
MKAYINYPAPHITLHWDDACPSVQQHGKKGQRVIRITSDNVDTQLARFINREFTFAATPGENDMWLDVSLGSRRQEEAVVLVIQSILGRRYQPLASARVTSHDCRK